MRLQNSSTGLPARNIIMASPGQYQCVTCAIPRYHQCMTCALPWRYLCITKALPVHHCGITRVVTCALPWHYVARNHASAYLLLFISGPFACPASFGASPSWSRPFCPFCPVPCNSPWNPIRSHSSCWTNIFRQNFCYSLHRHTLISQDLHADQECMPVVH